MKKLKDYPLTFIGIIGVIIMLIIACLHSFATTTLYNEDTEASICPVCYHCAASNNGEVFYTDRVYPTLNELDLIRDTKDAEERLDYLLDYNKGNFTYDRIVCRCSEIKEEDYVNSIQRQKDVSNLKYNQYIEGRDLSKIIDDMVTKNPQKGPKQ